MTITRNNAAGLKKTRESIEVQNFTDFEWIIIDGASTDGSFEILQSSNATWISEPDTGIYNAMNKGLARSQGQYILFLNAGDRLAAKDTLQNLTALINHEDFIYGDALEDQNGHLHPKPARKSAHLKFGMFTHHQAMLYNRKALQNINYNETYKIAGDYDLTARLLQKTGKTLYAPFPICIFESGGISQTKAILGRREQYKVRKNLKLCGPITNTLIFIAQTLIWNFRQLCPRLYWLLKSSGNTAGESAQTPVPQARPKTPA